MIDDAPRLLSGGCHIVLSNEAGLGDCFEDCFFVCEHAIYKGVTR